MSETHALSYITRAVRGRCPQCGTGKLFARYLKPVEKCADCGENLGHIRADDGPAWLTILLVGHILAPILLAMVPGCSWPDWLITTFFISVSLILCLAILPRAKGLFIAILWRMEQQQA